MPDCPNSRSDGSESEIVFVTRTPFSTRRAQSGRSYLTAFRRLMSIFTILSIERQRGAGRRRVVPEQAGLRMSAAAVDLSDFALWRNGFPDELFAELRRASPLFRHALTPGVAKTV